MRTSREPQQGNATPFVALTLLATILTGCGLTLQQRAAVQKFSAATIDFATLTSSELVKTRTDVIEMNDLRLQLKDAQVKPENLDAPLTVERVKVRVDAVDALKEYAQLLQALVDSSQTDQIKSAADGFVTSIRKVQGVNLSDEKAGAIGAAVAQVGGLIVEYKRAKAAREVATVAHPTILTLVDLVRRDFGPEDEHWSLAYDRVVAGLKSAAVDARDGAEAPRLASLANEADLVARRNKTRFGEVATQVDGATAAMRQAQINLMYALQSKDVTVGDIDSYVAQIKDFVSVYRIVRDK